MAVESGAANADERIVTTIPRNAAAFVTQISTQASSAERIKIARIMQSCDAPMIFHLEDEQIVRFKQEAKKLSITHATYAADSASGTNVICSAEQAWFVIAVLNEVGFKQVDIADENQMPMSFAQASELHSRTGADEAAPERVAGQAPSRRMRMPAGRVDYFTDLSEVGSSIEFMDAERLVELVKHNAWFAEAAERSNVIIYISDSPAHQTLYDAVAAVVNPERTSVAYENPKSPEGHRILDGVYYAEYDATINPNARSSPSIEPLVGYLTYPDSGARVAYFSADEMRGRYRSDLSSSVLAELPSRETYFEVIGNDSAAVELRNELTAIASKSADSADRGGADVTGNSIQQESRTVTSGMAERIQRANGTLELLHEHGYVAKNNYGAKLVREEAVKALELGVRIGAINQNNDYHGSHSGEYSFTSINSVEQLDRVLMSGRRYKAYNSEVISVDPTYEHRVVGERAVRLTDIKAFISEEVAKDREKTHAQKTATRPDEPRRAARALIGDAKAKLAESRAAKAEAKGKTAQTAPAKMPELRK